MFVRGIRGATTAEINEEKTILASTKELLKEIILQNNVQPEDIACVYITVTEDITATFPAKAIRELPGWDLVPLMCALEIPVPNSLKKCIRLMVQINTEKSQKEINHVYLKDARSLRPDIISN